MTATLFDSLRWTDRYAAGDEVHDGLRTGVILAAHDCAGGMQKRCVTVEYANGHRTTFGYDHTFLPLGGGDATAVTSPSAAVAGSLAGNSSSELHTAGENGPGVVRPTSGPRPQNRNSTRPSCAATPGA